jgi:hypothetical protein
VEGQQLRRQPTDQQAVGRQPVAAMRRAHHALQLAATEGAVAPSREPRDRRGQRRPAELRVAVAPAAVDRRRPAPPSSIGGRPRKRLCSAPVATCATGSHTSAVQRGRHPAAALVRRAIAKQNLHRGGPNRGPSSGIW